MVSDGGGAVIVAVATMGTGLLLTGGTAATAGFAQIHQNREGMTADVHAHPEVEREVLRLFDSYQRAAPRDYEPTPVRVVDIDEETIRRMGQWPWPRNRSTARLTRFCAASSDVPSVMPTSRRDLFSK